VQKFFKKGSVLNSTLPKDKAPLQAVFIPSDCASLKPKKWLWWANGQLQLPKSLIMVM